MKETVKRFISRTLILVMLAAFLPAGAGTLAAEAYSGGNGTEADPYLISTAEDLIELSRTTSDALLGGNSYRGKYFEVTKDIDFGGSEENYWVPIGDEYYQFQGNFNGGGHKISGLYMGRSGDAFVGLFGYLGTSGTVRNLAVSGSLMGAEVVGGVVGYNRGTVSGCYYTGSVYGNYESSTYVDVPSFGGVVGYNLGIVSDCYNTGSVNGHNEVGGVVGYNLGTISDCYNTGSVTGAPRGGVAGSNYGSVTSSYYLEGSATTSGGGEMKTAEQFADQSTFEGWDFMNTWIMSDMFGRPILRISAESGVGTQEDPYRIPDLEALERFRDSVNGGKTYSGKYVELTNNIDMSGSYGATAGEGGTEVSWTPIGVDSHQFMGTFNGGGYEISGLYIDNGAANYQGLFGYLGPNGTIHDLGVSGSVTGRDYVGGVVGYSGDTVSACYNIGDVKGNRNVGGAVGDNIGSVTACYYLEGTAETSDGGEMKTEEQFASGEVAWLLQSAQEEVDGVKPQVWGQTLSGETPDAYPVLTDDNTKAALKVSFMTTGEQEGSYTEYAAAYANPSGTVTLPANPTFDEYEFVRWSQTQSIDGDAFTDQTQVTADMTVYAVGEEMYGDTGEEHHIETTYGVGATQDLSEYMTYAAGTDASGRFTYEITGGNNTTATANGNTVNATIDGDTLSIPADTNADTYTLTIRATNKEPAISLASVDYATDPVSFNVTVVVNKAASTSTPEPTATATIEPPIETATPTATATAVPTEAPAPTATATATAAPTETPTAIPTPTATAIPIPPQTPAPTATATAAPTATIEPTATPGATATAAPTETPTAIPTATATAIPISPQTPTPTATAVPTATPAPTLTPAPTATATIEPTSTPIATATAAPTETPTAIPTATATAIPIPPQTPAPTATAVPTATPAPTSTPAPTATATIEPTATPGATATAAPTETPTAIPTATATAIPIPPQTPTPTATATATAAPTEAPTASPTAVPTEAPAPTSTPEPTATATVAPPEEPTATPSATATAEPTEAPTASPTATAIPTQTPESTLTPEPTATSDPITDWSVSGIENGAIIVTAPTDTPAGEENYLYVAKYTHDGILEDIEIFRFTTEAGRTEYVFEPNRIVENENVRIMLWDGVMRPLI